MIERLESKQLILVDRRSYALFAFLAKSHRMNRTEDDPSVLPASHNDTDQYIVMQIAAKAASVVSGEDAFFSVRTHRDATQTPSIENSALGGDMAGGGAGKGVFILVGNQQRAGRAYNAEKPLLITIPGQNRIECSRP